MPVKVDPRELVPVRVNPSELVRVKVDPSELVPQASSGPSRTEAAGRGLVQGATLGFADELNAMARAGAEKALADNPETGGVFEEDRNKDTTGEYARLRDEQRAKNAAAREAHGGFYLAGNVAGALPAAMAAPAIHVAKGAPLLTRALAGAASAAPVAAVMGAGESEGQDAASVLKDTLKSGWMGAAGGAAVPVVAEGVRRVAGPLRESSKRWAQKFLHGNRGTIADRDLLPDDVLEEAFQQGAIKPGRSVRFAAEKLGQSADDLNDAYFAAIAKLEEAGVKGPDVRVVQAMLRERGTNAFNNTGLDAVKAAYMKAERSMGKVVPGAGTPSEPIAVLRRARGAMADPESPTGQRILYEQSGDVGPRGQQLRTIVEEGRQTQPVPTPSTLASEGPPPQSWSATRNIESRRPYTPGKAETPTPQSERLQASTTRPNPDSEWGVALTEEVPDQFNTSLTQQENIKRARQAFAKYHKRQGNSPMERANKDIAWVMRQANEDAITAQASMAPEAAAEFVPVKRQLGRVLEALKQAEKGANRSALSQTIGLKDAVLAAGELAATGSPANAVKMGFISKMLQSRGPSTAAWSTRKAAGAAENLAGKLGPELANLFGMEAGPDFNRYLAELLKQRSPANAP